MQFSSGSFRQFTMLLSNVCRKIRKERSFHPAPGWGETLGHSATPGPSASPGHITAHSPGLKSEEARQSVLLSRAAWMSSMAPESKTDDDFYQPITQESSLEIQPE